jgi:hypothetical protein
MTQTNKFLFHLSMFLSVATMLVGHWIIRTSGAWLFPGKEKYNIDTRWVSDFAAVWPQRLWIKGSIAIFCIALSISRGQGYGDVIR